MKKAMCIAMVLVMMFVCSSVIADEEKTGKAAYERELKLMSLLYKLSPEALDSDKIVYTYLNFMLYLNCDMNDTYVLAYGLKKSDGGKLLETAKKVTDSGVLMSKVATDAYVDWSKGNLTDAQFAEVLMDMVNGLIEDEK